MIELDSKPISKDLFWPELFLVTWVLVQSKSVCAARKSVWNWMWQQSLPFPRSSFCFQKFLKIQYNTRVLDSRDSCCKKLLLFVQSFWGRREASTSSTKPLFCLFANCCKSFTGRRLVLISQRDNPPTDLNEFSKGFPIGGHFQSKSCHSRLLVFKMSFWSWFVGKNAGGILSLRCNVGYKRLAVCQHNNYNNIAFQCNQCCNRDRNPNTVPFSSILDSWIILV